MKIVELKITEYQRDILIEALSELSNKYISIGSLLIKPDDIMLNDDKLTLIDMLSQYIRSVDSYDSN